MSHPDFKKMGSPEDRVIEECAEMIQAIVKAKRFGWKNYHPDRNWTNNAVEALEEIKDVREALNELEPILQAMLPAGGK